MITAIKALVTMFTLIAIALGVFYVDVNYTDGALSVSLMVCCFFVGLYRLCYLVVSDI